MLLERNQKLQGGCSRIRVVSDQGCREAVVELELSVTKVTGRL